VDEAPGGVRVNSVSPGNIYTPLWQEAIDAAAQSAKISRGRRPRNSSGRMGCVEEVARLCLFIASGATLLPAWITSSRAVPNSAMLKRAAMEKSEDQFTLVQS
jgi:NAD(P)-dependent dehydrogenase (short-subunit alcohol dehydrogenase family)